MNVATIMTNRLILRPLKMDDVQIINEKIFTDENTEFMLFRGEQTIEETTAYVIKAVLEYKNNKPEFIEFGVCSNDVLIGIVTAAKAKGKFAITGTSSIDRNTYELGWILDPNYKNKGFMKEAIEGVIEYSRKNGAKRFIAHADVRNIPSINLMEKLGMKRVNDVGTRKYPNGETSFELVYDLIL